MQLIDDSTDPDLDLHLIADNYCTHKHPKVETAGKSRHPRFRYMHFIPTSSSLWLNLVERHGFRDLTDRRIRRGVFRSVPALIEAIEEYIEHHNDTDKGLPLDRKAPTKFWRKFATRHEFLALDKTPSE